MRIAISTQDITHLITRATWSGDRTQAARKLEFEFAADDRDILLPTVDFDCGYTVYGGDDEGNVVFVGNIYDVERNRKRSTVKITAFDNLFVLNKSKTTRKYTDALPEEIAAQICSEMGILTGDLISTGERVTFIANGKTGYQIITEAYNEAAKKDGRKYQCVMDGVRLNVIEKGAPCGVELSSTSDLTESIYKESIENIINRVLIADEQGNGGEVISDDESIRKYSMFQAIYKVDKEKDTATEAKALMKAPTREGQVVTVKGDYRLKAGYGVVISDAQFKGQFWIKSDTHTFEGAFHETKLILEFENLTED